VARKKKPVSIQEEIRRLMDTEDLRTQILQTIQEKAVGGDLKTIEFILKQIEQTPEGKGKQAEPEAVRIEMEKGVEGLAE
jgi:hypothetical protein